MNEVILDCREMTDRERLHGLLARELHFPEWYGRNLDALFDLLTTLPGQWTLLLTHASALEQLGNYKQAFLDTLQDAQAENPHLHIELIS